MHVSIEHACSTCEVVIDQHVLSRLGSLGFWFLTFFIVGVPICTQVQYYFECFEVKLQDLGLPFIDFLSLSLLQLPDSLLLDLHAFQSISERVQVILLDCNLFHAFRLALLYDLI